MDTDNRAEKRNPIKAGFTANTRLNLRLCWNSKMDGEA